MTEDGVAITLIERLNGTTHDHAWLSLWTCIFSSVVAANLTTRRSKD